MARKLRLEFPGACYHVIDRGNYRADVFKTEGAKAAFEACLFEACVRSGWLLYAFVIMRNHFHAAIETPAGNLALGMHWLLGTFASRFNRLRGENGHLFQGRYKAPLVEEGEPMGMVSDYIHLNPVRARIVPVARLTEYRYSSYWYLRQPERRPPCLRLDLMLESVGQRTDNLAGWESYDHHLRWQAEEGPAGKSKAYVSLSKSWALGSAGFKATLLRDHAVAVTARAWESKGAQEIREQAWEEACRRALQVLNRGDNDLKKAAKAVAWKVALALFLKERSQASNRWLGRRLCMGSAKYVSYLVSLMRRAPGTELAILRRQAP